jgi:hypothetical protein
MSLMTHIHGETEICLAVVRVPENGDIHSFASAQTVAVELTWLI